MRISYDPDADTAYIRFGDTTGAAQRSTTQGASPPGVDAFIALDWDGERLIGIEILDASARLPTEVLEQADQPS